MTAIAIYQNVFPPDLPKLSFAIHSPPRELPDFSFKDVQGKKTDLSAFQGKVVVLNIWATWCLPCRIEMPSLDRLSQRFPASDLQVVALSIDSAGIEAINSFYNRWGIRHLAIFNDPTGRTMGILGARGVPTSLLLDRKGRMVGALVGPSDWDDAVINAQIEKVTQELENQSQELSK